MGHVVLLGDSIFDNGAYVPGGPPVVEQLRAELPAGWRATLAAVDGACARHVAGQFANAPADATHLVVSAGGNDALGAATLLDRSDFTASVGFDELADAQDEFRRDYRDMLQALGAAGKPTVLCTVYHDIPNLARKARTALSVFNDVIQQEAFRARLPVIDLRLVCTSAADYSTVSPIEPSRAGGGRIVEVVARVVAGHDFGRDESVVYGS